MGSNILILDSIANNTMLKEITSFQALPFNLIFCNSATEALEIIKSEQVSLLMVGDGIVMQAGFEIFPYIRSIPTIILCEAVGFNSILKKASGSILFLIRPFGLEGIPGMFDAAHQFLKSCKEE
ncbi:MAG: hypothetical protein HF312_02645 [Ignavibacteria bacterium]|nr:hypothetical protein [Ignavibacteria bacterium]MCU7519084.1 hypothetical protein [Ignavibacteria bacterium]